MSKKITMNGHSHKSLAFFHRIAYQKEKTNKLLDSIEFFGQAWYHIFAKLTE